MSIEALMNNKEYCISEMRRVREMWENKNTFTMPNILAADQTLAFMFIYCPKEIQDTVLAHLNELERRKQYLIFKKELKQ